MSRTMTEDAIAHDRNGAAAWPERSITAPAWRDVSGGVHPCETTARAEAALAAAAHPYGRLTEDSAARKRMPLAAGLLDYFPDALAAVAEVSFQGNEKHNPGEPIHWTRGKSNDHADCIARHLIDRGRFDSDGTRHSAALAWRALANLQLELEAERGLPISRGSR